MRLLNVYLRQMGEVVAAHDGIVDKFIGDNVMATFGVLRPVQNAAQSAAACAQGMIERMDDINKQLKERGRPRSLSCLLMSSIRSIMPCAHAAAD